jgi:hypothetical protein
MKKKFISVLFVLAAIASAGAQKPQNALYDKATIASIPKPVFGQYTVGDDYFLANYQQLLQYLSALEKASDRIQVLDVGVTPEGRPFKLVVISSPENLKNLEKYRQISVRLAKAEGLTDEQARELSKEGKAVVWIDGGLHATETVNAQALFVQAYDLLARNDDETQRILDNVITLLVLANPDGMDLVSDWYMKDTDPKKRNMNIPRLYQKYVGHDNNRDSYIANQIETEIINKQMYIDWIPQIMYNQHQSGPAGTVLFMSPFRDPFNHNHDPLVPLGIDLVGSAVHHRFLEEGKGGAVKREEAAYSTWFNGGDRTTVGFHNQIGLLSEIKGGPTPMDFPLVPNKLVPYGDNPLPVGAPKDWRLYQSIDYIISADRAILDIAARLKDEFLFRIYRAGTNSIERGSRDYWTITPKWIDRLNASFEEYKKNNPDFKDTPTDHRLGNYFSNGIPPELFENLKTQDNRDPRGYIVPADQADFLTATKFINALLKAGVDVHRATADFKVNGKTYPAGSYIVKAAQAFRPHLRDMFEPQDHPNDLQYPGGPPKAPYDLAGYTLAYQMDIRFDRILDDFNGPFEKIEGLVKTPAGKVFGATAPKGYLLSHQVNDAFTGTTKLLAAGEEVYWLQTPLTVGKKTYPAGTIYIPAKATTAAQLQALAGETGLDFEGIAQKPQGAAWKLHPVKVALWDTYGGSMPSGWIRWLFEQQFPFFDFEVVYPKELDKGKLRAKYDVIILPPAAFPSKNDDGRHRNEVKEEDVPAEYRNRLGKITIDKTAPELRTFVEDGGTVIAIGSSVEFGRWLNLPLTNAIAEIQPDGSEKPFPYDKFYISGSVLRVKVDNTVPIAYGISEDLDILYANNPVFRLAPDAGAKGVKSVAWFPTAEPLRSGWAQGQHYLNGGTIASEASVGKGKVLLFGNEITYRGQSHGAFKFLFNGIYYAGATHRLLR